MLCTEGVDTTSERQVGSDAIWQGEDFGIQVFVPRTCPIGVPSSGGQFTPYQATVTAPIDVAAECPVDFYNKYGGFLSEALGEFGPDGESGRLQRGRPNDIQGDGRRP